MTIADDFDVFLIDLDGVVYLGGEPLSGAVESLNRLGRVGKKIRYLTNDPRPRRETVAGRLRDLGVRVDTEEIVTSGWAAARYLDHAGIRTVSVVGSEGLSDELRARGLRLTEDDPEAVVVGADERTTYRDIQRATRHIHRGMTFDVADSTSDDARYCIDAYFDELDRRFDVGFDPSRSISADADELTEPEGLLLLARLHGEPVGCGALKLHEDEPAEIKRMWVDPSARGLGLGRRLLNELEEQARVRGVRKVRLETNRTLTEAIRLYRSAGYEEVEPFNEEPYAHHWFEKRLDPVPDEPS